MPNAFQFRSLLGKWQEPASDPNGPTQEGQPTGHTPPHSHRANRSQKLRDDLEKLTNQVEHARRNAHQMMEEMSALEVDAGLAASLRRANETLREKLEDKTQETIAEAAKSDAANREVKRLQGDIALLREDHETSRREASAIRVEAERIADRLRMTTVSLEETKRDLELQREAKDTAEVDAQSLRATLAERDRVQSDLIQKEAELRLQAAKLQSRYEEATASLGQKKCEIADKASQIASQRDRIAELETDKEATRQELRELGSKHSDLKTSHKAQLGSLSDELGQERASHQVTSKLLEETRDANRLLSIEVVTLKEQIRTASHDQNRMQCEFSSAREQLREAGEELKQAELRLAVAESENQRIETLLEEARKEAMSLKRQASVSDQLLRENTDLHGEIAGARGQVDRYPDENLSGEVPVMLSSTKRGAGPSAAQHTSARPHVASTGQNVARIARR